MPEDPEDEVAVGGLDRLDTLVVGGPGAGGEGLRDCVYPLVVMALDGEPAGAGRPRRQGIWLDPYLMLGPRSWHRPVALVDLYRVASAEGYVGATFTIEMNEIPFTAGAASGSRVFRLHFAAFIAPDIKGEQGAAHLFLGANQQLDGFRSRK